MSKSAQATLQAGIAAGLLPAGATLIGADERPWPVVLLIAVGAWFAAVPLLFMIAILFGDLIQRDAGPYFVGLLVLVAAVMVMRAKGLRLFVEQLAVPALLVGGGTLAFGVYRDFDVTVGSLVMLAVVLVVAQALPKPWLRVLLGTLAAGLLGVALQHDWDWMHGRGNALMALYALLGVWLLALWLQERAVTLGALIEAFAAGWLLTVLAGFVWLAGATFLLGGAIGSNVLGWVIGFERGSWQSLVIQASSSGLVLVGAGIGSRAWSGLRQWLVLAVALVLAGLAWFMPLLGAVLLALMVASTTQRWRLASACALVAAWIVGGFYYQLQWSLADKAMVLVGAGVVLGALAWLGQRKAVAIPGDAPPAHGTLGRRGWALVGGALLTLVVANGAIWQKQDLIARGKPIYLALVPVDPRSLMQGDFMRLRFSAIDTRKIPLLQSLGGVRPKMVVQLDAHGVATGQRVQASGQPLVDGELLLELTPKNGSWVVVTDAWFFKEGDAKRWELAKFGEFRVLPDGRALLVGMADAELRSITP